MYKVNWDVAYDVNKERIGIGIIIRDHESKVMDTLRARTCLTNSPFIAKYLALLMDIQFCKDVGIHHFILKGGAL